MALLIHNGLCMGAISALLGSTSTIIYRKSLSRWKMGTTLFILAGSITALFASVFLMIFEKISWNMPWYILAILVISIIALQWNGQHLTEINSKEKISTVQIFGNLRTAFVLIAGFILFGDTSWITLGIVFICVGIIFASQFEGKTFSPPKEWKKMTFAFFASG